MVDTVVPSAKQAAREALDASADRVVALSRAIHAKPELAFEEVEAAARCVETLDAAGFAVTTRTADIDTAFEAVIGSGSLTIGICCEYDALPGIGHACGHNVIAAAGVGAGLALAQLADDLDLTVKVFGTPAEEVGGGKVLMLQRGAFDGVHLAMMVHPAPFEADAMACLAISELQVTYTGRHAHASAMPQLGLNAADAMVVAQTSIGLLRQHLDPASRVHGIVTNGGEAPNIIPGHTAGRWYIRHATLDQLAGLRPRVEACFEAGAVATGCTVDVVQPWPAYSEMRDDTEVRALWKANAEALGRRPMPASNKGESSPFAGSTDMANVSLAMPSIHPMLGLDCFPAANHQPEFTAFCATEVADKACLDGAVGMAWTAIDAATTPALRARLQSGQRVTE